MTGRWIEDLSWPEVGEKLAAGWPVVLPIGARSKEHGHHLPMCTDYLVARALCDGIAAHLPVLIAPVVDFGYYPAFLRYPGSQHLRAETFIALLTDLIEGLYAQGCRQLAILNTGVSTEGPVQIVARDFLVRRGRKVALEQKMGGHGDEHETSLLLAIAPERVDMTRAVTDYGHMLAQPESVFVASAVFEGDPASGINYSATGVRGDPTLATVAKGKRILAAMVGELVDGMRPYCSTP